MILPERTSCLHGIKVECQRNVILTGKLDTQPPCPQWEYWFQLGCYKLLISLLPIPQESIPCKYFQTLETLPKI